MMSSPNPALCDPAGIWRTWPEMFCPIKGGQPHRRARDDLVGQGLVW